LGFSLGFPRAFVKLAETIKIGQILIKFKKQTTMQSKVKGQLTQMQRAWNNI
jgi:hypothetical protein